MSIRKRTLRGIGANAFGQIVTVATQLLSVPLYLTCWGEQQYGEWLILAALPTFIAQGGGGFASAGGTEMILAAHDDKRRVEEVFQTSSLITLAVGVLILLGAVLLAFVDLGRLFGFRALDRSTVTTLLIAFAFQVSLQLVVGLLLAGYRAAGKYATGFMWQHGSRLAAFVAVVITLLSRGTPSAVAFAMVAGQAVFVLLGFAALRKQVPWLSFGFASATFNSARSLVRPSLADTLLPLAAGLRSQSMVAVIGYTSSASAVVAFTAFRTLSSLVLQLTRTVNRAVQQEMSAAIAKGDLQLLRRMYDLLLSSSFWASVSAALALAALGPVITSVWLDDQVAYNATAFFALLLGASAHAVAMVNTTLARSMNKHESFSLTLLACIAAGCIFAVPVVNVANVTGAAIMLALVDLAFLFFSTKRASALSQQGMIDAFSAMVRAPWRTRPGSTRNSILAL
ncbi:hypothetical protein KOR34_08660 [Posidoniimonas corsicana]|uniref:Polysaccharide biosynthesis protein n=1 Tax=Posidoniimonas corsicana TaxID=1938618 RepID=A0A5C5VDJ2_9BACT|nr:hypothetical protein [Posidoniimonas corsicana]TWT35969.1 hypothetical protein KOR34_08660 [Posidoniimonas corsicana]